MECKYIKNRERNDETGPTHIWLIFVLYCCHAVDAGFIRDKFSLLQPIYRYELEHKLFRYK